MDTTTPLGKFRAFVEAKVLPATVAGFVAGGAYVFELSQNQVNDFGQTAAFMLNSTSTEAPADGHVMPDPMGDGPGYKVTRPEPHRSGELLVDVSSGQAFLVKFVEGGSRDS